MTYYERNLPHWHPEGAALFVTWRLHGSLPADFVTLLRKQSGTRAGERFARAERFLDGAASGPLWLAETRIAKMIAGCVVHGEKALDFYRLVAFVIMPNHVHLLVDPKVPMKRITAGIKGVSAREANLILGRAGQTFWQVESFDHWVRDAAEELKIKNYIEQNPVKARLVARPEDWPWSSAAKQIL